MVTIRALEHSIASLMAELRHAGFPPRRVILFGSYAKGHPDEDSDIDVAVWADGFEGARVIDIPKVAAVISRHPSFELHPFAPGDNAASNPFIEEIEKTGRDYSYLIAA